MKVSKVIAELAKHLSEAGDVQVLIGDIDGEQISDIYVSDDKDQVIIEHYVT